MNNEISLPFAFLCLLIIILGLVVNSDPNPRLEKTVQSKVVYVQECRCND